MEQRSLLSDRTDQRPGFAGLTRAEIAARLARPRDAGARGDVATAHALLGRTDLERFDQDKFGPLPSSGIPYESGAGAPGIKLKRTPAAVLVPLIERQGAAIGFDVVLTLRPSAMTRHAGQVAFPGGRMDAGDADVAACALREAEEEIGLARTRVEVLGQLDPYLTITGFEVTPVVGAVTGPVSLSPDSREVADVFDVPLEFLLDPANHQRVQRDFNGIKRAYYAVPYQDRYIWGATAGMILNMYEILSRV
ncbi:MAG: CoA pyrophosphatase [Rhodobacteraceae bacterium]|nr:CoA pyrophosphatase [Paracoccaceae bacterium]